MAGTLIKRLEFPTGGEFLVVVHDLLKEPVDCIVNAANGGLSHGGGVAAAIAMAAGPELDMESGAVVRERATVPPGAIVAGVPAVPRGEVDEAMRAQYQSYTVTSNHSIACLVSAFK